jgi:leucyl-tRNA synthetase
VWPEFDESVLGSEEVEIIVQVNGKVRDRMLVPVGTAAPEIERAALELPKVVAALGGASPSKVILVPGKLLNVVVK